MKYIKVILLLFLVSVSYSQNSFQEKPFIEVVGTSEKKIIPDEIYLEIYLEERIEKGNKLTLEILENQLKQALKTIEIPESNLFISDINSVLAKTGWFSKEILSTAKYSLKVNSSKKLKQLFESFEALKITNINITKATHSKIKELKKENRIAAIKEAKEKANYLLSAIKEKVGKAIKVNERNINNNQPFVFASNIQTRKYSADAYESKKSITQFEEIVIKTSVYVKFEIE